jgi:hypothetical protein
LENEREQASPQNRAAIKFVHLDVGFRVRSDIHHVCHFIVAERATAPLEPCSPELRIGREQQTA